MAYFQTDLQTLLIRLEDRAGDGGVYWQDPERQGAINEAICVWQAMTGASTEGSWNVDASAGAGNFFPIPRQIVTPQRLTFNGTELSLISEWELDNGFPGWEGVSGTPLYWTPIGFTEVAVYPYPLSGTLTFTGVNEAPVLDSTGDYIDVGAEELSKFLMYGHYYLTFKEGGLELDSSKDNVSSFIEAAGYMNGRLKETNFYKRALGLVRDDNEKPRAGEPSAGVRLS